MSMGIKNNQGNGVSSCPGTFLNILLRCGASILSGLMLFTAFPPLELAPVAWISLVPLLLVCSVSSPGEAFKHGFLTGCVFWLLSISWLTHVSGIGWVILSLYCALYVGSFAAFSAWWIGVRGVRGRIGNPDLLFVIPASWITFEFIRSTFATGFPWNPLGVSQFKNLALIQSAEWGGVYIVSWIVAIVNVAIALTVLQYWRGRKKFQYRPHPELILSLAIASWMFWYGNGAMRNFQSVSGTIRVAAIQPNIPQVEKWSEDWLAHIYDRLRPITLKAIHESAPDLVVWPETAVPDFARYPGAARDVVDEILKLGVPLLVGSLDYAISDAETNYYNSSMLFMPDEAEPESYDKQHLVLFGEYIPMEKAIPFVRNFTPVEGSLTSGTTGTVFQLSGLDVAFSVLICFEDTVARIARTSVRNGARLLINQTNDAWFDPSSASRQQMSHCIFRCVENRVAAVRATNTGVTCFIDRNGNIYGELGIIGPYSDAPIYSSQAVFVPGKDMSLTFYTKYGDIFVFICIAIVVVISGETMIRRFRKKSIAVE